MRKLSVIMLLLAATIFPGGVLAQEAGEARPPDVRYYRAVVTEVVETVVETDEFVPGGTAFSQTVRVRFTEGPHKGNSKEIQFVPGSEEQELQKAERVVVVETDVVGGIAWYVVDRDRRGAVLWLAVTFLALVTATAGWKGLRSLFGLAFTILVIVFAVVPNVVAGGNPFVTFLVGGLVISVVSIYLGHGFTRRTTVAVVATLLTLGASVAVAAASIRWTKLFGLGSEEAFFLQSGNLAGIDLRGLLLGGVIIGILGVLDDITTAQAATVEEIHKANPALSFRELARRGLSVGHEHIISLVNTLALAYVGASLPLLLLFTQAETPLWVTLNSELITEEIVRTLVGSAALVIAVPVTTYLAAWFFARYGSGKDDVEHVMHAHRH